MASRKKYSTMKNKKIEPSVLTMTFSLSYTTESSGKQKDYIDLSQCASVLNRRFYRQGINWAVSSIKILSVSGTVGQIQVQKLPNTWVMSNSWEKGFRAWQKMNNEALAESQSVRPKFLDFKIYADEDHHVAGYSRNLMPISGATIGAASSTAKPGEWESSKLRIPDAVSQATRDREIIAVGPSFPGNGASGLNAVSLIEGYAASRGLPNIADPNTPDDADSVDGIAPENWIAALFNEGTEQTADVLEDMITENNVAPYPFENGPDVAGGGTFTDTQYPGGANNLGQLQIHDSEFLSATTVGGKTVFKGGNFPCGLVCIATSGISGASQSSPVNFNVQVELVPGNHRGYLCEPMTEM